MEIPVKSAVLVGTFEGLPMYRLYLYSRLHRNGSYIHVVYDQWLEAPNGNRVEFKNEMYYVVKDLAAVLDEEGNEVIPAFPAVTGWYYRPTGTVGVGQAIDASIDETLQEIPMEAESGYVLQHQNAEQ